jgi:GNAT superfamily N-acetyltransferase
MSEPIVRRATCEDADALFALVKDFATSFKTERDLFDVSLSHILGDESAWLAAAELDGVIVGYCLGFDHYAFYANGRVSWVEEIMVRADLRGQGIGRTLMDAFEEWSIERGSKLVALATRRAAPFYTALGYEDSAIYFRKLLAKMSGEGVGSEE